MALPTDDTPSGVKLDTAVPTDWHPDTVKGDGPGARLAKGALKSIYETHGKIVHTAESVQDKPRLAQAVTPLADTVIRGADKTIQTLNAQIEHYDKAIAAALKPPVEHNLAGQIRTHWASQENRLSGLQTAIHDGDLTTIAAVLNAPPYLSGLTAEQHGVIRAMAAKRFAQSEVDLRTETEAALRRVTNAASSFMEKVGRAVASWKDEDAKRIEEGLK